LFILLAYVVMYHTIVKSAKAVRDVFLFWVAMQARRWCSIPKLYCWQL
jgi:hypothetical protein